MRSLILASFLLLGTLSACAREEATWTPAEAPKRVKADWRTESHAVTFAPGAAEPSADETAKLARFLQAAVQTGQERLFLGLPQSPEQADGQRTANLRRIVAALAPDRPVSVVALADPKLGPNRIAVTVGRYVVTTPSCPDWRKPANMDPANSRLSNLGCANETNLGLMVADPSDLVVGQSLEPGDGSTAAIGVERYRADKLKPLPKDPSVQTTGK